MITKDYNPSPIEVQFVEILSELKEELNSKFIDFDLVKIKKNTQLDNPTIDFSLIDKDGDEHEIILKVIQKPDKVNVE